MDRLNGQVKWNEWNGLFFLKMMGPLRFELRTSAV